MFGPQLRNPVCAQLPSDPSLTNKALLKGVQISLNHPTATFPARPYVNHTRALLSCLPTAASIALIDMLIASPKRIVSAIEVA